VVVVVGGVVVVVVGVVVDSSEDSELPPHPASRAMHANAPISFFTP
jgi:hypothetical protein